MKADDKATVLGHMGTTVMLLAELYDTAEEINLYLKTPHALHDNEIPADLIWRGDGEKVIAVINQILEGVYL